MPMITLKDYSDEQLLGRFGRSMTRLFRLRAINAPTAIIEKEETINADYLAECRRRGFTDQQLKDAADAAFEEDQAQNGKEGN